VKLDWFEVVVLTAALVGTGVAAFLLIGLISSPL
jgi:hypothetical protein